MNKKKKLNANFSEAFVWCSFRFSSYFWRLLKIRQRCQSESRQQNEKHPSLLLFLMRMWFTRRPFWCVDNSRTTGEQTKCRRSKSQSAKKERKKKIETKRSCFIARRPCQIRKCNVTYSLSKDHALVRAHFKRIHTKCERTNGWKKWKLNENKTNHVDTMKTIESNWRFT